MKRKLALIMAVICLIGTGCGNGGESVAKETTPRKAEEEIKSEAIENTIANMSIEEKVGQLLMADFRTNPDGSGMTVLTEDVAKTIGDCHLGGVILFAENLDTAEQTKTLTAAMEESADIPLFIGIDEEGGIVSRLNKSQIPHEVIPPAEEMADNAQAEAAGKSIGGVLAEMGINVDFAPIADVNTNPDNTVIGNRAFSAEPEIAAERVAAFVQGLQQTGVSGAAKHFPGHGDTAMDSHNGETYVEHTIDRLRKVEFVPFKRAVEEGVDFVMVGHIKTPNATTDNMPASLSKEMLDILRQELGFQGIIITDAMNMGAITQYYGSGESAVLAVQAGVDIVLMPSNVKEAAESLLAALEEERLTEARLDESLRRIFSLKYEKGLLVD